ncbi:hypothetical protein [Hydrocarboniphaga effusa]|uniref:hypothetical protein n=1 Tax=Hydrocarboniphaga effusa TaxID=243629 RepID=UPI00398BD359
MTYLKQRVDGVLALQEKATPGPWHFTVDEMNSTVSVMVACIEYAVDGLEYKTSGCVATIDGEFFDQDWHDAAFISSAHKMADLLREQQAEIERLRKDAERYWYLRDVHIGNDPESINLAPANEKGLDAAIDRARALEYFTGKRT